MKKLIAICLCALSALTSAACEMKVPACGIATAAKSTEICYSCNGSAYCEHCDGMGVYDYSICDVCNGVRICRTCIGSGILNVQSIRNDDRFFGERGTSCTDCCGSGYSNRQCTMCSGTGTDPAYDNCTDSVQRSARNEECTLCGGTGSSRCSSCQGTGKE